MKHIGNSSILNDHITEWMERIDSDVIDSNRLKNEHSTLSQILRLFKSKHRLLLTGTPLQVCNQLCGLYVVDVTGSMSFSVVFC
jgi:hypothetical protein